MDSMKTKAFVFGAFVAVVAMTASTTTFAEQIHLEAKPGEFNAKTIGSASTRSKISVSLRIAKFASAGSSSWPTAAYIGFHQGANRDNSVQILVIRNRETDNYVVAGYRIIEGGKEIKAVSVANFDLDAVVRIQASFDKGDVTLKLEEMPIVTFHTQLTSVAPYISVSSGAADFVVND